MSYDLNYASRNSSPFSGTSARDDPSKPHGKTRVPTLSGAQEPIFIGAEGSLQSFSQSASPGCDFGEAGCVRISNKDPVQGSSCKDCCAHHSCSKRAPLLGSVPKSQSGSMLGPGREGG